MGFIDILRPNIEKLRERKDIPGLIRALESPDEEIRDGATGALLDCMPDALSPLVSAAVGGSEKRRAAANAVLASIGEPAVLPLIGFLEGDDPEVSGFAAVALASVGEPAVSSLVGLFGTIDEEKSERVVETLAAIGPAAIPGLKGGLFSLPYRSRRFVALTLDRLNAGTADETEDAARRIALGQWKELGSLKEPGPLGDAAILLLIDLLSEDYYVPRVNAVRTLGQLGDERALPHLKEAVSDENPNVRAAAAEALGSFEGEEHLPLLLSACVDEDHFVRQSAAASLDRISWHPSDDDERVMYFIATRQWKKAAEIGEAAVLPLIRMLRDTDNGVMKGLTDALRSLERYSVGPLEEALNDPDIRVRNAAGEILVSLGHTDLVYRPLIPKVDEGLPGEKRGL